MPVAMPPALQKGPTKGFRGWLNSLRAWALANRILDAPGGGIEVARSDHGVSLRLTAGPATQAWIKLTAAGAGGKYAWVPTTPIDPATGTWDDAMTGGGTATDNPAIEANGNATLGSFLPLRVPAWQDGTGGEWVFFLDLCP